MKNPDKDDVLIYIGTIEIFLFLANSNLLLLLTVMDITIRRSYFPELKELFL